MTTTTLIRILAGSALATLLAIAVLASTAGAAGKTDTLKLFSKQVAFTYTKADGTVSQGPPTGPPQPGDSFEIDSLDYRGTHKKHSKKPVGADYLHCVFNANGEPDCTGYAALHDSLLRFHGFDLIGAVGRYKDAKFLSHKEVPGGNDFVIRLVRR